MVSERVGHAILRSSARDLVHALAADGALSLAGRRLAAGGRRALADGRAVGVDLAPLLQHALLFSVHCHDGTPSVDVLGQTGRLHWSRAGGTRTPNRRFWRPVLYQLSHCPRGELSGRQDSKRAADSPNVEAGGSPGERATAPSAGPRLAITQRSRRPPRWRRAAARPPT